MNNPSLVIEIKTEQDILDARRIIRNFIMENLKFSPVERMHVLTAVSELARNIYRYAKEGYVEVYLLEKSFKKGIKLVFIDHGPGMDVEEDMKPNKKSLFGMGIGLQGSKNLADEFEIYSKVGEGTKIIWIKWERE